MGVNTNLTCDNCYGLITPGETVINVYAGTFKRIDHTDPPFVELEEVRETDSYLHPLCLADYALRVEAIAATSAVLGIDVAEVEAPGASVADFFCGC